jgi:hypothetical protein
MVTEVRRGQGPLHSLVYADGKNNLVTDLNAAARILRTVAEEVAQGKGIVGGLLRDPTVYQDLKLILGNVKRNAVLKALIRSAIQSEGSSAMAAVGLEGRAAMVHDKTAGDCKNGATGEIFGWDTDRWTGRSPSRSLLLPCARHDSTGSSSGRSRSLGGCRSSPRPPDP